MSKRILLAVILVLGIFAAAATATPGRLDKNGGHKDSVTGIYHYHRGPNAIQPYDFRMNSIYRARVIRVVDGDTAIFTLMLGDGNIYKDESTRFIGVNTPETVHPNKPVEYYGKEASNFTKSQLKQDQIVWLQTDVSARDRYGRLLAYIWLKEPSEKDLNNEKSIRKNMFNARLLLDGYAQAMTVQPTTRYADMFAKFQREARENNKGLWAGEK